MEDARHYDDLTVRIAWLYYRKKLTQQEIADMFRMSRATVARTLNRSRNEGIVEFRFAKDSERMMLLEERIGERYGLDEVILARAGSSEAESRSTVAQAAASYLERSLRGDMIVGLGASRTLHEMASVFTPRAAMPDCVFVEMVGGIAAEDPRFDTYNVSWQLARKCGGTARHLFTPAVVDTPAVKQALLNDGRVSETLKLAARCDIGIVAIGLVSPSCPLVQMGDCDAQAITNAQARGAVGEIIGRFYDSEGTPVRYELDDRLIGLDLEEIAAIPFVVAIAVGVSQVPGIVAALRRRFIKVLITDADTGTVLSQQSP